MAAGLEFLTKLKFSTEVDQKAFKEIQKSWETLSTKQRNAFAKQYNTTKDELNKLFGIQDKITKEQEKQVKSVQQFAKALGGPAAVAGIAKFLALNSSMGLSQRKTGLIESVSDYALKGGAVGAALGAGPIGAAVGAALGAGLGAVVDAANNTQEAFKASVDRFAEATGTYSKDLNSLGNIKLKAGAAGMSVPDFYMFEAAAKAVGIEDILARRGDMMARLQMNVAQGDVFSGRVLEEMTNGDYSKSWKMLFDQQKASGQSPAAFFKGMGFQDTNLSMATQLAERGGFQPIIDAMSVNMTAHGITREMIAAAADANAQSIETMALNNQNLAGLRFIKASTVNPEAMIGQQNVVEAKKLENDYINIKNNAINTAASLEVLKVQAEDLTENIKDTADATDANGNYTGWWKRNSGFMVGGSMIQQNGRRSIEERNDDAQKRISEKADRMDRLVLPSPIINWNM